MAHLFRAEIKPWWDQRKHGRHLRFVDEWSPHGDRRSFESRLKRFIIGFYFVYALIVTGIVTILWSSNPSCCWPV